MSFIEKLTGLLIRSFPKEENIHLTRAPVKINPNSMPYTFQDESSGNPAFNPTGTLQLQKGTRYETLDISTEKSWSNGATLLKIETPQNETDIFIVEGAHQDTLNKLKNLTPLKAEEPAQGGLTDHRIPEKYHNFILAPIDNTQENLTL